jgi:hypothetical protein
MQRTEGTAVSQRSDRVSCAALCLRVARCWLGSRARCGVIGIFTREEGGCWFGLTCAHIFATSWVGGLNYNPDESIIGKVAYSGTWIDREAKDDVVTVPGSIHMNRPIGIVIDQNKSSDMAFVRLFRHINLEEGSTETAIGDAISLGSGAKLVTTFGDADLILADKRCAGPTCTRPASTADLKRCAGCNRESYCSKQCQKDDRNYHKQVCRAGEMSDKSVSKGPSA